MKKDGNDTLAYRYSEERIDLCKKKKKKKKKKKTKTELGVTNHEWKETREFDAGVHHHQDESQVLCREAMRDSHVILQ